MPDLLNSLWSIVAPINGDRLVASCPSDELFHLKTLDILSTGALSIQEANVDSILSTTLSD